MITANRHPIVRGGYPRSAGADPSRRAGRAQVRSYSRAIDPTTRYAVTPRHRLADAIRRRSGPGRDPGLVMVVLALRKRLSLAFGERDF